MPDKGGAAQAGESQASMNRLVPYLDLFDKLGDVELSRLASVPQEVVARMRVQVIDIQRQMARYRDLLPRLSDGELSRLTHVSEKTVRFWRLTRPSTEPIPEVLAASESGVGMAVPTPMAGDHTPIAGVPREQTGPHTPVGGVQAQSTGPHTPLPPLSSETTAPNPTVDDDDDIDLALAIEDDDEDDAIELSTDDEDGMDWSDL